MKKNLVFGIAVLACMVGAGSFLQARARGPKQVTPWEAIKLAEAKTHGKAFSTTYLIEDKTFYDIILVKSKKLLKVEVDASSGEVSPPEETTPEEESKDLSSALRAAVSSPKLSQ